MWSTTPGGDCDRAFQWELSGKHTESAQRRALFFREQLIAPIERGAERLMAGQCGAPARRQQSEAII